MTRMAVTYVLPKLVDHPIGGYKVHYQYVNALARRGHAVTLVHPVTELGPPGVHERVTGWRVERRSRAGRRPISWFEFDPSVRSIVVPALEGSMLPDADVTVLTGWQTAASTLGAPSTAGALVQVVYDYEFWVTRPDRRPAMAAALGRGDVAHLATSSVVAAMLREIGVEPAGTLYAGLLEGEFAVDVPPAARGPVVGFARRFQPSKDPTTALAAIEAIHGAYPEATVVCFGDGDEVDLPSWVERLGRVSSTELRAFYNRCAVFLLTSIVEGWGLPALEAMACGAAVVTTASGGVADFVHDGVNGRIVAVGDAAAVAAATLELLGDRARRATLATRAAVDAHGWSASTSAERLESFLCERVAATP